MKFRFKYIFFCFFALLCSSDYAQNSAIDSLENLIKRTTVDTIKLSAYNELFIEYEYLDEKKAQYYLDEALALAKSTANEAALANTYILCGYFAEDKGDYQNAMKNYTSALKKYEVLKNKKGMASAYNNIAAIYSNQGNYPEALKCLFLCLKIDEALEDKEGLSSSYSHIAIVYAEQGDLETSLKYHLISLNISKEIDDQYGISGAYNNIGNIYNEQKKYDKALENYMASLEIKKRIGDEKGVGSTTNNISSVYTNQAELETDPLVRELKLNKALEYCSISLAIREAFGDKPGIASVFNNMGIIYTKQKKYVLAEEYLNKSKAISHEIGYKEYLRETYFALSELNNVKGNYKSAYENHKLYILYRDSLDNEETRKKTIQTQMTYDFEKKEAVAAAEHKKELENQELIADEKSRKQRLVLILVSCFLVLVVLFAGFVFRSLRITKKQKRIIELQKEIVEQQKQEVEQQKTIVEEHQKEIIDSITYARRIQRSLLPTEKYIDKNLNRLMSSNRK